MRHGPSPSATPDARVGAGWDRLALLTYGILVAVTLASWAQVLSAPAMDDMAGTGMVMAPSLLDGIAYVAGWGVMMAAMMLPSALPMIGLYAATQRRAGSLPARATAVGAFTLTYLAVWAATGVPIYLATVPLAAVGPRAFGYVVGAVLVAAGVFQLSPLKQACLRSCRSPLGFLLGNWRAGWRGALALGWKHAIYCLGCCWALMVVLVAAGAMGLAWVLLVAVAVATEKLLPRGDWIARALGVILVVLGVAVTLWPELAMALRPGARPL